MGGIGWIEVDFAEAGVESARVRDISAKVRMKSAKLGKYQPK
jgi:hypothetical protein